MKIDESATKILTWAPDATSTEFGAQEFWASPNIEIGSDKFKWLEAAVWVAQGRWVVDENGAAVEARGYRLKN